MQPIAHLCQSVFIRGSIAFSRLNNLSRILWRAIRRLSGDDGYERYLAHHAASHPDAPALPRRTWFALQQQQKWSGIKRCC